MHLCEGVASTHTRAHTRSSVFPVDTYSHIKRMMLTSKDLLCSTGNSIQYLIVTYVGNDSEKAHICAYN